MKASDKAPVNGYRLVFTRVASYHYPIIERASDGAPIWSGASRPYQGRKTEAYAKFRAVAGQCAPIPDNISSREELNAAQISAIARLSGIFLPGGAGSWEPITNTDGD